MTRKLALDVGPLSHPGQIRELNEDSWGTFEQMGEKSGFSSKMARRKGRLYAVADGMGGHAAGEVASKQAINALFKRYYSDPNPDLVRSLERAFRAANAEIHTQAEMNLEQSGMGTTLVAALIKDDQLLVANVGDSRAYLIHAGQIEQITTDHSWVSEQVEAGLLTSDEARQHVYRNIITRSMGNRPEVEVDIFTRQIVPGDAIVLCTDGLTNEVRDEEIRDITLAHNSQEAAKALIALANERGGSDNMTTVVIKVRKKVGLPIPLSWALALAGVLGLALFGACLALGLLSIPRASPKAIAPLLTPSHEPAPSALGEQLVVPWWP